MDDLHGRRDLAAGSAWDRLPRTTGAKRRLLGLVRTPLKHDVRDGRVRAKAFSVSRWVGLAHLSVPRGRAGTRDRVFAMEMPAPLLRDAARPDDRQ
jgi:hypothetical protein